MSPRDSLVAHAQQNMDGAIGADHAAKEEMVAASSLRIFNEAAAASGQEMVRTNSAHPDSQLRYFSIHRYACLMNIKKSQVYSWHSRLLNAVSSDDASF
jgi:hypothetical protein